MTFTEKCFNFKTFNFGFLKKVNSELKFRLTFEFQIDVVPIPPKGDSFFVFSQTNSASSHFKRLVFSAKHFPPNLLFNFSTLIHFYVLIQAFVSKTPLNRPRLQLTDTDLWTGLTFLNMRNNIRPERPHPLPAFEAAKRLKSSRKKSRKVSS